MCWWVSFVCKTVQTWSRCHSPTFSSLHLRHSSFSNTSDALPKSQLIFQPFRCFSYVTAHSPTLPSLYLRHSSFSNPSVASPTSQLILQPFFRFSYVTGSSLYVTYRAAHEDQMRWSPLHWWSVNTKDAGRPWLSHHHGSWWNKIKIN